MANIFTRCGLIICGWLLLPLVVYAQPPARISAAREAQRRVVKIYGAGGLSGLEAYQSGVIVSPEGHIATVWSYVLDVDDPLIVLDDGRRFSASIVGFEPKLEFAVLKIDASELPYFPMTGDIQADVGAPVLAVSNLFSIAAGNEPASVMQGYVAVQTQMQARRGTFQTPYSGDIYVLDLVANNPGAAGGALVDLRGNLLGMLGKELRDQRSGAWLNYAIPTAVIRPAISDIIAGRQPSTTEIAKALPPDKSHAPDKLGMVMLPNVLEKTPAYIDRIIPDSPAAKAGLLADDLILLANGQRIEGQTSFIALLRSIDNRDPVSLTVQRGSEIVTLNLRPR